ncbi:hypothetical protein AMTR_s00044p00211020, partial [Amborella trichopoda]
LFSAHTHGLVVHSNLQIKMYHCKISRKQAWSAVSLKDETNMGSVSIAFMRD